MLFSRAKVHTKGLSFLVNANNQIQWINSQNHLAFTNPASSSSSRWLNCNDTFASSILYTNPNLTYIDTDSGSGKDCKDPREREEYQKEELCFECVGVELFRERDGPPVFYKVDFNPASMNES
jgi:hypothetical protein